MRSLTKFPESETGARVLRPHEKCIHEGFVIGMLFRQMDGVRMGPMIQKLMKSVADCIAAHDLPAVLDQTVKADAYWGPAAQRIAGEHRAALFRLISNEPVVPKTLSLAADVVRPLKRGHTRSSKSVSQWVARSIADLPVTFKPNECRGLFWKMGLSCDVQPKLFHIWQLDSKAFAQIDARYSNHNAGGLYDVSGGDKLPLPLPKSHVLTSSFAEEMIDALSEEKAGLKLLAEFADATCSTIGASPMGSQMSKAGDAAYVGLMLGLIFRPMKTGLSPLVQNCLKFFSELVACDDGVEPLNPDLLARKEKDYVMLTIAYNKGETLLELIKKVRPKQGRSEPARPRKRSDKS